MEELKMDLVALTQMNHIKYVIRKAERKAKKRNMRCKTLTAIVYLTNIVIFAYWIISIAAYLA